MVARGPDPQNLCNISGLPKETETVVKSKTSVATGGMDAGTQMPPTPDSLRAKQAVANGLKATMTSPMPERPPVTRLGAEIPPATGQGLRGRPEAGCQRA